LEIGKANLNETEEPELKIKNEKKKINIEQDSNP